MIACQICTWRNGNPYYYLAIWESKFIFGEMRIHINTWSYMGIHIKMGIQINTLGYGGNPNLYLEK